MKKLAQKLKFVYEYYCDGPNCPVDGVITPSCPEATPIVLSHGYGSPMDDSRQDFCSLECLKDWVNQIA